MGLGFWEILVLGVLALLIFGAGRLPKMMGDLGQGIRSFKSGLTGGDKDAPPGRSDPS